jgi:hypothetical protein
LKGLWSLLAVTEGGAFGLGERRFLRARDVRFLVALEALDLVAQGVEFDDEGVKLGRKLFVGGGGHRTRV